MAESDIQSWTLNGAENQTIFGDTHRPIGESIGAVILCHGFKGYKDYGFFPYLAQQFADSGFVAHRFNFSHSGMTNNIETFERADLFEQDTWGKQHYDLLAVTAAVRDGRLAGQGVPIVWFGHSRGGLTTLTAAGQVGESRQPDGIIAVSSPDRANNLLPEQEALLKAESYLVSPSSRTGQQLRIGSEWLEEIEQAGERFDPCAAVKKIICPLMLIHGTDDQTVSAETSRKITDNASRARLVVVPGADHVFGAPNPMPIDTEPPAHTCQMARLCTMFLTGVADRSQAD